MKRLCSVGSSCSAALHCPEEVIQRTDPATCLALLSADKAHHLSAIPQTVTECQLGPLRTDPTTSRAGIQITGMASSRLDLAGGPGNLTVELCLLIRALDDILENLSRNSKTVPLSTSRSSYTNEASDVLVVLEKIRSDPPSNITSRDQLPVPAKSIESQFVMCHSVISQHSYIIHEAVNKTSYSSNSDIPRKRKRIPWTSMRRALRKQKDDIKIAVQFS